MTPESQRIAIAEACPFVKKAQTDSPLEYDYSWFDHKNHAQRFDPLNDLNAMHEAEKMLTEYQQSVFANLLADITPTCGNWFEAIHATAAQRAEAFLKCLGKWVD